MAKKPKRTNDKASANERPSPPEEDVELAIEHIFPEGIGSRFANYATVQFDGHEYHLSFFEIKPPLALGTPEERREKLKRLGKVPARCVAQLVMTPARVSALVRALVENMQKNLPEDMASLLNKEESSEES